MHKKIAIMQPTFLPWLGYFSLIDNVDEFIFLDHVQFQKRSWQQRNKIRTYDSEVWISVPVSSKGKRNQTIKDTEIIYEGQRSALDKILSTIKVNYKKAPFYEIYFEEIASIFDQKPKYISDLNQNIIKWACRKLQINTPFVKSSSLIVSGSKADLLANICKSQNSRYYISPPGSKVYLDESSAFQNSKISISYFNYIHPKYKQVHGEFIPYMCVLDLLFNVGPDSGKIMRRENS
tara:strand:- start:1265 stop:1969 length:705 start_codon:yes stop_codon:yes gene_type:complete